MEVFMFGFSNGNGNGSGRGGNRGGSSRSSGSRSSGSRSTGSRSTSSRSNSGRSSSRGNSNVRNFADYLDDGQDQGGRGQGRSQGTRTVRSSTGRNPGTVTDPARDGRLHHGDMEVGMRGQPLESYDEWIESHHVPHPGAIGNQNARGPHNIPEESMERIREGGSRGGKAHLGMRFERIDGEGQNSNSGRRSSRSNSGSRSSGMSSRASGSGMRTGRGRQQQQQQQQSMGRGNNNQIDIQELRDMRDRLDEVLNEIAG
jgi:hypothetical protein